MPRSNPSQLSVPCALDIPPECLRERRVTPSPRRMERSTRSTRHPRSASTAARATPQTNVEAAYPNGRLVALPGPRDGKGFEVLTITWGIIYQITQGSGSVIELALAVWSNGKVELSREEIS